MQKLYKKILIIIILITIQSCQVKEYECVCYYNEGDKISYDKYIVKNNKFDSEKYCSSLSTSDRNCMITK